MAVTGLRGSEVRDAIRQFRGDIRNAAGAHMPVMGLNNADLIGAMDVLGWHVVEKWSTPTGRDAYIDDPKGQWFLSSDIGGGRGRPKPRLRFAEFLAERGADGPFIVNVTGHYMAVSHGEVCDAASTVLPTEIDRYLRRGKFGYRQSWVRKWWKFTQ